MTTKTIAAQKSNAPKKERRRNRAKVRIEIVGVQPMTKEEEHRFTAAIDALLSEIVRQELGRNGGNSYGTGLEGNSIHLPGKAEQRR
jgi:hypothetical protein